MTDFESDLKLLLSHSEKEILQSPDLSEVLRRVYTKTYGRPERFCQTAKSNCLRQIINSNKMGKTDLLKKVEKRTLVPSETFIKAGLVKVKGGHVRAELMHDEQAILMLEQGTIPKTFFTKFPDGYKQKETMVQEKSKPQMKTKAQPKR